MIITGKIKCFFFHNGGRQTPGQSDCSLLTEEHENVISSLGTSAADHLPPSHHTADPPLCMMETITV